MNWYEHHEEVDIEEVRIGDKLIWPEKQKALEVFDKMHETTAIDFGCGFIWIHYKRGNALHLEGPRGGTSILRRKKRGEGYIQESERGNHLDSTETIYRV